MTDETHHGAMAGAARSLLNGQPTTMHLYQLIGRIWLVEFNSERAADITNLSEQQWAAENALLAAYAALEALILETALIYRPNLYADRDWRRDGLTPKFKSYLEHSGRAGEPIPSSVKEISDHRIAMTHSEPDNNRTSRLNEFVMNGRCQRLGVVVREVAMWLWQGQVPNLFQESWQTPRPNVVATFPA